MPGEQISLIGIPSNVNTVFSSIVPGHELPMEPGNHLRWFFPRELGFPNTLTLYWAEIKGDSAVNSIWLRDPITADPNEAAYGLNKFISDQIGNQGWIPIEEIFHFSPFDGSEGFYKKGNQNRQIPAEYQELALSLHQTLENHCNPYNSTPLFNRRFGDPYNNQTTIKEFDALTLASLDPFVARLMGLYFIDERRGLTAYRAMADYGQRTYPLIDYNFNRTTVERIGHKTLRFETCTIIGAIGNVWLGKYPDQQITSNQLPGETCLFADQVGNQLMLGLSFEQPVEEVEFYFRGQTPPSSIKVVYPNGNQETLPVVNYQVAISPPPTVSRAFSSFTLIIEGVPRTIFRSIAIRSKKGPIGTRSSNICIIYENNTPPNSSGLTPTSPPKVEINALRQFTMPPVLDSRGILNTHLSTVKIAHTINNPSNSGGVLFYGNPPNPVRYVLGRMNDITAEEPQSFLDTTHLGLVMEPDPTFLGLLAYFDFQKKNFTNRANQQPAEVYGEFEYGLPIFKSIDLDSVNLVDFPQFSGQQYVLLSQVEARHDTLHYAGFTLGATVFPMQLADGAEMTIFDYNRQNALWFGLVRQGAHIVVRLVLNGQTFDMTRQHLQLATQPPRRLIAAYDGAQVKLFVDQVEEVFEARLGPLRANPSAMIAIGADVHTQGTQAPQSQFFGHINDVHFWAKPMTPYEVKAALVDKRSLLTTLEVDNPYTRNLFGWADNFLPDGGYTYRLKGIDIFGRIDSAWSTPWSIPVRARPLLPNTPQSVQARFLTPVGRITSAREVTSINVENEEVKTWAIEIAEMNNAVAISSMISRHDMFFSQTKQMREKWWNKPDPDNPDPNDPPKDYQIRQQIEIGNAAFQNGLLQISGCVLPAFAQIQPLVNDPVSIAVDKIAEIQWQWTGLQQIYNPEVSAFELYYLRGGRNQIEAVVDVADPLTQDTFNVRIAAGAYTFSPNAFAGRKCDINNRQYTIDHHDGGNEPSVQVNYIGEPIIVPQKGDRLYISLYKNDEGYQDLGSPAVWGNPIAEQGNVNLGPISGGNNIETLQMSMDSIRMLRKMDIPDQKLDWIPENGPLWELRISGLQKPLAYEQPNPKTFVPGALVAGVRQAGTNEVTYEVFYLLWHDWSDGVLRIYADIGRPANAPAGLPAPDSIAPAGLPAPDSMTETPDIMVSAERPLHFYIGRRFSQEYIVPEPVPTGKSTETQRFTVRACTADGRKSTVASPATLVAVDRRKPAKPESPRIVSFGKADFHNLSEVGIQWDIAQGSSYYNLYRATDADIFATDLENRRLRQGSYAGDLPLSILLEGATGMALLQAFRHKPRAAFDEKLTGDWSSVQESDLFVTDKQSTAWKHAAYFWNYWAAWFYPTLDNEDIKALAEKTGNESAFTLVNSSPIAVIEPLYDHQRNRYFTAYSDKVNGAVSNRYYYRLRSMGQNLAQSTQWGAVSLGEKAETPAVPPRTPVFTKVEAGDRQVTLQWALNREPDLKGYILYRSRQKELLDDLRWFEAESPNGNALVQRIEIPDPRIVVRDGRIVISDDTPIQSVVGVYRAEEYDFNLAPGAPQPKAVNFWIGAGSSFTRVADGYQIRLGRLVADGVEAVVVIQDPIGVNKVLTYSNNRYPFVDSGLLGLTTYYYKLAGKNGKGVISRAGEVQSAKALEIEPPAAPVVLLQQRERVTDTGGDTIQLTLGCEDNLDLMIQARKTGEVVWTTVLDWTMPASPHVWSINIEPNSAIELKIWSRTSNKMTCVYPTYLYIP